jgi:thiosulfate/3-mercaptopyruvate sulfurtransferase
VQTPSRRKFSSYVVTPSELAAALKKSTSGASPRIIPLSAAWFLPNHPRSLTGFQSFLGCRIRDARFFDLDAIKDHASPYPHMLPSPSDFAKAMSELGIRNDDKVVVYDTVDLGLFSAPRVGWTLKVMGHKRVHVLNNFRLWVEEGYPTESGLVRKWQKTSYEVPDVDLKDAVVDFAEVKEVASNGSAQILDARPEGRFLGKDPEPRPGLPSGHIPSSISVPLSAILDPDSKALLRKHQLRKVFEDRGIAPGRPVISSCGTGVTAAVLDMALEEAGFGGPKKLYDGSWTEWAQRATEEEGLIKKGTEP